MRGARGPGRRVAVVAALATAAIALAITAALASFLRPETTAVSAWRMDPLQAECRLAVDPAEQDPGLVSPLGPGQPPILTKLVDLTPLEAREALLKEGLCHTFRSMNRDPDDPRQGFSEVWCTSPTGIVAGPAYDSDGSVVVFVSGPTMTPRPQPEAGWGCGGVL